MSALSRNNVTVTGNGDTPMLFAHGYGCDQQTWRLVAPAFTDTHCVITAVSIKRLILGRTD